MDTSDTIINIAILGPVSAGKSTLLNALFSNTFSDMQRKKTTMMPQYYNIIKTNDQADDEKIIRQKNTESNKRIFDIRTKDVIKLEHMVPLFHKVSPITDFIELPPEATYQILDMPGLNDGGDEIYYQYIDSISHTIDIYVLVFDINSCLNTTDEITILQFINSQIEKNQHGYVHVLINKCDSVEYTVNGFGIEDVELKEMYDTCSNTVHKYINGCITIDG